MKCMFSMILWYLLLGVTAISAVALFVSILNENDKQKLIVKIEPPKMPEGLDRHEVNKIVNKLLKEEAKRAKGNRRVW